GAFTDIDHVPGDFEPVAFAGHMLKGVADIAQALAKSKKDNVAAQVYVAKREKTKTGTPASPGASVVTFPHAPGTVLYIMPMRSSEKIADATAEILAPAIKGTLAALKAHKTRNEKWAAEA